jgi:hypothetical protein
MYEMRSGRDGVLRRVIVVMRDMPPEEEWGRPTRPLGRERGHQAGQELGGGYHRVSGASEAAEQSRGRQNPFWCSWCNDQRKQHLVCATRLHTIWTDGIWRVTPGSQRLHSQTSLTHSTSADWQRDSKGYWQWRTRAVGYLISGAGGGRLWIWGDDGDVREACREPRRGLAVRGWSLVVSVTGDGRPRATERSPRGQSAEKMVLCVVASREGGGHGGEVKMHD